MQALSKAAAAAACRDYVKKVAVYKDKLAVQLPTRVLLYELAQASADGQPPSACLAALPGLAEQPLLSPAALPKSYPSRPG
jgi:hypothetical protein